MRGRAVQPIAELDRRMPRAGKIKLGAKTERAMKKLTEFRFLSPYRDCIEALAEQYGGTVRQYNDPSANPPSQWEVYTNAASIEVGLLRDGIDACYEMWGGGMRQRVCDGVTVTTEEADGDDYIYVDRPCICSKEGMFRCKPKLRIVVILPNVPMRGAWLLETGSWFAQNEMPGMFDLITELSARGGLVRAALSIDQRTDVKFGKGGKPSRRNYVVPVLNLIDTPMALMSGGADMRALAASNLAPSGVATPALPAGTPVTVRPTDIPAADIQDAEGLAGYGPDDDIVLAEIVDPEIDAMNEDLRKDADWFGLDADRFIDGMWKLASMVVKGEEPTRLVMFERLRKARQQMKDGQREPIGIAGDGTIQWRK